ncbi:hypothetical protein GCM10010234_25690 [Streptomyces hawaiiensis]
MAIDVLPIVRLSVVPAITGRPDQRKRSVTPWPMNEGAERVKLPLRLTAGAAAAPKTRAERASEGVAGERVRCSLAGSRADTLRHHDGVDFVTFVG